MGHRTLHGRIRYTSNQEHRLGAERGWENFIQTVHPDGRRTLQARCEIDDPPPVLRHVTLSLDPTWRPLDCFVRLDVGGDFMGSGWFHFTDRRAESESINVRDGRISQRMDLDGAIAGLGSHPIAGDAWLLGSFDLSQGPGRQFRKNYMLTSPDHRGATGPALFRLGMSIVFVGEERVTVEAGTFDALHFQFTDTAEDLPEEHPPYDIWCTADGDYVFLKAAVGGYMQTAYELVSLTDERSS
ncbi:MAG: hypothetical protein AAGE01_13100 [Pseudomonadota bacterium]